MGYVKVGRREEGEDDTNGMGEVKMVKTEKRNGRLGRKGRKEEGK